jgi:LysR family cyn operon transcriptional activator
MEFRHVRYFQKTAEMLSFTQAADALQITQSTLSHQINALERETGKLFERAGRGIRLTSRGKLFKACAERIQNEVRGSLTALAALENVIAGSLSLGVYRAFETSPLPRVLAAFRTMYPGVALTVYAANHIELAHRLIDGTVDLAVTYAPSVSEKIVSEQIFVEPLVLMVGRQHPLFGRSHITLEKVADQELVSVSFENRQRQAIQRCLSARGIVPRVAIEMNSNEAVLAMVKCSAYATICPEVDGPDLHAVQIHGFPLRRSTVMLWRRDSHRSAAAKTIAPMIKAAYSTRRGI